MVYSHEEPHKVSYISIKYDFAVGAARNGTTQKWLLITATSVKHVVKDGASSCSLWLRLERDEDKELRADICCNEWERSLDPSKPMTSIEKRHFGFLDVAEVLGIKSMAAKNLQIRILQSEHKR
jgi:hypothetical protein